MVSKCFYRPYQVFNPNGAAECPWVLEVEHMDAAVEELRNHYRAVHPRVYVTWGQNPFGPWLEEWNRTVEEWLDSVRRAPNNEIQWGQITYLWGEDREYVHVPEPVLTELRVQYDAWAAARDAARQAQRDAQVAAGGNADANPDGRIDGGLFQAVQEELAIARRPRIRRNGFGYAVEAGQPIPAQGAQPMWDVLPALHFEDGPVEAMLEGDALDDAEAE